MLAGAHLLVMPSLVEGGANVIGEAIVHGVPPLASRIDGNVGLLGADWPGLYPAGDRSALAALLADKAALASLGRGPALAAFDWRAAKAPLLFVHHRDDACWATSYQDIPRGVAAFPLVSVRGGKPPESGPCDPLHAHGFYGKEPETVDAIAAWMLKKPFRREID